MEYIYGVEYDKAKTNEGDFARSRYVDETYEDEKTFENKTVTYITEEFEHGKHSVTIIYDNGTKEKTYDISRIFYANKRVKGV